VSSKTRLWMATTLAAGTLALAPAGASGALTLSPSSLSFSQQVGTTSAPQTTTLTLTCDGCFPAASYTPTVAATPAAFTQTSDCVSLFVLFITPDPDSCTINVTFTASAEGPVNGTLSTGMGGPTATLTGTGVAAPVATAPAPPVKRCRKAKKKPKGAAAAKGKCKKKRRK
jgi:hypothetical protein